MRPLLQIPASYIHYAHSAIAFAAFSSAFALACKFHYKQVVKNGVAGWPDEWMPSVSASIGDWAPERPIFQILIALCAGPRFLLILVQWLVTRRKFPLAAKKEDTSASSDAVKANNEQGLQSADWLAMIGVARTFCCGGWVYVTSTDHHDYKKLIKPADFHDAAMIAYLVLTLPWMCGTILSTPPSRPAIRRRRVYTAATFHTLLVPLIYFFIQHKVHKVKGAYSYYAIFEWSLVLVDVLFDAWGVEEVKKLQIQVVLLEGGDRTMGDDKRNAVSSATVDNRFWLSEGLLPAVPILPGEKIMEHPAEKAGWAIPPAQAELRTSLARSTFSFIFDVYLALCFWTIFTQLGLQLFYFSVWELALSGSELSLLAILSPWLLSIPSVSRFSTSRRGMAVNRALGLFFGLGAYKMPLPSLRLLGAILGNVFAWLEIGAQSTRLKGGRAAAIEGSYLMLGLIASLVLKLTNNSTNPFWCIVDEESGGYNKTGIVLAFIACCEKSWRPVRDEAQTPSTNAKGEVAAADPIPRPLTQDEYEFMAAGIGSLLFLVQTLVTDAGTVIAWNWDGYPVDGPRLLWQASAVIGSAVLGLITYWIRDWQSTSTRRDPWVAIFFISWFSCYVLCGFQEDFLSYFVAEQSNWIRFGSGCLTVGILVHLFPLMWQDLSRYNRDGRLLSHALGFNIALDVISVITVAYAFVPGGHLLRERMGHVVFGSMICVVIALIVVKRLPLAHRRLHEEHPATVLRGKRLAVLGTVLLAGLLATTEVFCRARRSSIVIEPYHKDSNVWTAGIWTVHFGVDLAGRDSQRRMLDLIRDAEVDVLGLLETDLQRFVYGNRDLTRMIAEELGYYVDIGPGPNKHTWGAVLLSKFPILESQHHLLPSPRGELAPAISAKLLINNQVVNVIVSHNGQEEDALDRQLQTEAIANISSACHPEPLVFLGYVVTHVGAVRPAPYEILMSDGRLWDVEIQDRDRWCEYIAFRNLWRIGYARISHGDITDTEMQLVKFFTQDATLPVDYRANEELYFHTYEHALPEDWQFPQKFQGEGIRNHRYHVFKGPIYYLPPQRFWERHNITHWEAVQAQYSN